MESGNRKRKGGDNYAPEPSAEKPEQVNEDATAGLLLRQNFCVDEQTKQKLLSSSEPDDVAKVPQLSTSLAKPSTSFRQVRMFFVHPKTSITNHVNLLTLS